MPPHETRDQIRKKFVRMMPRHYLEELIGIDSRPWLSNRSGLEHEVLRMWDNVNSASEIKSWLLRRIERAMPEDNKANDIDGGQ